MVTMDQMMLFATVVPMDASGANERNGGNGANGDNGENGDYGAKPNPNPSCGLQWITIAIFAI